MKFTTQTRRHLTRRTLVALAIGVLVTWALAWAMTVTMSHGYYFEWTLTGWYVDKDGKRIEVHFEAVQGPSSHDGSRFSVGTAEDAERMWSQMRERADMVYSQKVNHFSRFGIPFHALGYESTSVSERLSPVSRLEVHQEFRHLITVPRGTAHKLGWPWDAPGGGDFRLPTAILIPGFVMDALFWAAAAFALSFGLHLLRRLIAKPGVLPIEN